MAQERQRKLREELIGPLEELRHLSSESMRRLLDEQRKSFAAGGKRDEDAPTSLTSDTNARTQEKPRVCPAAPPRAVFVPSSEFRRPSDYVKHLARSFEEGKLDLNIS